jgi:hypothetical protein
VVTSWKEKMNNWGTQQAMEKIQAVHSITFDLLAVQEQLLSGKQIA